MPIENPPAALRAFIYRIEEAVETEGPSMEARIVEALRDVTAQTSWLPPDRRRANHENYARHILWCDPGGRFCVLSIVWDRGQQSPVHAHYTWCAVGVYEGVLTESTYQAPGGNGVAALIAAEQRGAGSVSFDSGDRIHRIANCGEMPAISIHVYGVDAERVNGGINRIVST
jgi:predicted metal-dependent enzyme (double-stranded beta helix superfamily)